MKLNIRPRSLDKKREPGRIRRAGDIPAVVYSRGSESDAIIVSGAEFGQILRSIVKGRLATTQLTLVDEKGKERKVLVKDIQYHPTTYTILHLDFEELKEGVKVKVKVPIECDGVMDCAGIKLGGVLRRVIRSIKVECLPKDIPDVFTLDVRELGIKQFKKLKDLAIPESVQPRANLEEVAVVIAKR